jgi:DHA1 family multidrug resistance protein-like MFS transporter
MKKAVVVVLILYFFQALIHNLGHPITPDYVVSLGIDNYMFGVFFAEMSFGLALGGLFWGVLGGKFNKKNLILIGLLIYSGGQFVFGNVHNVWVMNLARLISGFGVAGSVTLLLSYLVEKSDVNRRRRNIAYSAALMVAGAGLGYYIGGRIPVFLADDIMKQTELVFMIQAIVNTVFAFTVYFSLENCEMDYEENNLTMIDHVKSIRTLDTNLLIFLGSLTLTSIAAINLSKFTEVYIARLGYGSDGIGNFVGVTSIVSIITTLILIRPIIRLKKDMLVMIIVNLLSAIIITIVFRMDNIIFGLYSLFMVYVGLKAIYSPFEINFISSHAKPGELSKIMGIRQFFFAIGFVIGPLVGGILYDIKPIYVFNLSVGLFLIAFVLIIIIGRRIDGKVHE